jgi:hypothetical protein
MRKKLVNKIVGFARIVEGMHILHNSKVVVSVMSMERITMVGRGTGIFDTISLLNRCRGFVGKSCAWQCSVLVIVETMLRLSTRSMTVGMAW